MEPLHWLRQGDAVTQASALLLLAMSVASWVVMLYKLRLMQRARRDVARASAAFWQAPDWEIAQQQVRAFDRDALLLALVSSAKMIAASARIQRATADLSTLSTQASLGQQLTRVLRDALHAVLGRLQFGQVLLATVGSTAPFVGLLGTVWGIYHALAALAGAGHVSIEQLAAPVGEALIMTAAGLAVALPAVLGYNVFGRQIAQVEADLEGFAHDLRALVLDSAGAESVHSVTTD